MIERDGFSTLNIDLRGHRITYGNSPLSSTPTWENDASIFWVRARKTARRRS